MFMDKDNICINHALNRQLTVLNELYEKSSIFKKHFWLIK